MIVTAALCECGCGQPTSISPGTDRHHGYAKGQPRRFVTGHNMARTLLERFNEKWVETDSGCWEWTGPLTPGGYALIRPGGTPHHIGAHRVSYELFVAPIPDGLVIDHLCGNTACVNPAHLEAVTQRENLMRSTNHVAANARKTHCIRGHEFTPENTILTIDTSGRHRRCRTCALQRPPRHRERLRHG